MDRRKPRKNNFIILVLAALLVAGSCAAPYAPQPSIPPADTPIPGLVNTLAVQTMIADPNLARILHASTPAGALLPAVGTPTPFLPTLAITPTPLSTSLPQADTPTPPPTSLPQADTPAPQLTPSLPPATSPPADESHCIKSAVFMEDVTIPDGAQMLPNQSFTKIWRIKNNGTCAWKANYSIALISGHPMGASFPKAIGQAVRPGETVDIAIDLVAPGKEGIYMGGWVLQDSHGLSFANDSAYILCWITIEVRRSWLSPILDPDDFIGSEENCDGFG
ncbi:MAG: hypothetical protein JXA78_16490 [Anaerolineales bacterium]|nr:hypothetical protein [Anaerolineales bacterium]